MEPSFLPEVVRRDVGGIPVATVDARQLHAALRVSTRFPTWIKRRIALFDLSEGEDYTQRFIPNFGNKAAADDATPTKGARPTEYALTIKAAKQVALGERNAIGKAIRSHFIRCEEALREAAPQAHAESVGRMREEVAHEADLAGDGRLRRPGATTPMAADVMDRVTRELAALTRENRELAGDNRALSQEN